MLGLGLGLGLHRSRRRPQSSPPPPPGHRYWRIYATHNDANRNQFSIAEITMASTVGGTNIAAAKSYASTAISVPDHAANAAFDGNPATFWEGALFVNPAWISVNFGSDVNVAQFTMQATTGSPTWTPNAFKLQYSDDNSTWTDAYTGSSTGWSAGETRTFTL